MAEFDFIEREVFTMELIYFVSLCKRGRMPWCASVILSGKLFLIYFIGGRIGKNRPKKMGRKIFIFLFSTKIKNVMILYNKN